MPVCPSDISYLRAEGGDFCTSFNAYAAPHTTTEVLGTTSATFLQNNLRTVTQTITETAAVAVRRSEATDAADAIAVETFRVVYPGKNAAYPNATAPVTVHVTDDAQVAKRTVAPTPASVTGWDAARLSEACSAVATGTITDTVTTSVTTVFVATVTNDAVVTATTTFTIPGVALSSPTPLFGNLNGAPYDVDDTYYQLTLPFAIGAFGSYSTNVFLTTNGAISINSGSAEYRNDNYGFPTNAMPDVTIAGLWDDLYIYQGTQQGLYYEIFGQTGSRSVVFEIYESAYMRSTEFYHFSITFYENQPGVTLFKYYTVSRNGDSGSVGAQRRTQNKSLVYSHLQPKIHAGLWVKLDTEAGLITEGTF